MSDRLMIPDAIPFDPAYDWRGRFLAFRRAVIASWRRRATRRRITALDSYALKDIGVSYAEAEAEANKPFWRA